MKRSSRLEKIKQINSGFENQAAAIMEAARAEFERQENQLQQLQVYRDEYRERLQSRVGAVSSVHELQDYQFFFSSLDEAIAQQTMEVARCAATLESCENKWREQHQEVKKIESAAASLKRQEQAAALAWEQKVNDELAASAHLRRQHVTP